jgi:hypothetical protein
MTNKLNALQHMTTILNNMIDGDHQDEIADYLLKNQTYAMFIYNDYKDDTKKLEDVLETTYESFLNNFC